MNWRRFMNSTFVTSKDVSERLSAYRIVEDELLKVDVQIIPHYGWLPCVSFHFSKDCPVPPHNNISNLGYILHTFFQLFDVSEDGECMSKIIHRRVKLIYSCDDGLERCVAVGHPYKDKFIFFEDLMKVKGVTYG
jgi:hypothetical protein